MARTLATVDDTEAAALIASRVNTMFAIDAPPHISDSRDLLPMIPEMFQIASDRMPVVFHVAARSIRKGQTLIADHAEVMAARTTGWGMLCSGSVQETQDLAVIAHAAALAARLPFVHFFDGVSGSVSGEVLRVLSNAELKAVVGAPTRAGEAQSAVEYNAVPLLVRAIMAQFEAATGRRYRPFEYSGCEHPQGVVVLMGSGAAIARATVDFLNAQGARVGVVQARLFRPFSPHDLLDAIPDSVQSIAVLDRTSEPGDSGEPLYADVVTAFSEACAAQERPFMPRVVGGRYGLSTLPFTPAMVKAVLDNLPLPRPMNHFTVGLADDRSPASLPWDHAFTAH
jgi:pyruvate-ferredoxin/flavodoxin oxidoreductase